MELKVFELKNGKLKYKGIREVRSGDIIVEGEASMTETVHLRESRFDDINSQIMAELSGEERENFERGLQRQGEVADH